jgi:hypothetical protein
MDIYSTIGGIPVTALGLMLELLGLIELLGPLCSSLIDLKDLLCHLLINNV